MKNKLFLAYVGGILSCYVLFEILTKDKVLENSNNNVLNLEQITVKNSETGEKMNAGIEIVSTSEFRPPCIIEAEDGIWRITTINRGSVKVSAEGFVSKEIELRSFTGATLRSFVGTKVIELEPMGSEGNQTQAAK